VYEENTTKERDKVIAMMQSKIEEIGPSHVAKHCSNSHYVFDVAPSSIVNPSQFVAAVKGHNAVNKFLRPPEDPAYHIEILKNYPFL
jgi:hypothetical protein